MTPTQQKIEDFQSLHQAISIDKKELPWRPHLGLSIIGQECSRKTWMDFRWSFQPDFPPNVIRLFDRGHREEPRFVNYLRVLGIKVEEVHPETGKQFKTSHCDGHVGGSLDGFAYGFVEYPNEWVILEFKTHSLKSFDDLVKKGVKGSKPQHYGQMQGYMRKFKVKRAYYMAVCKNDDRLYTEWVQLDEAYADGLLDLSVELVYGPIPDRIALSSTDHRCRFCDHKPVCWFRSGAEPALNCRTCDHSYPNKQGTWGCTFNGVEADLDCYNPCGSWTKRAEYIKPQDIVISLKM